MRILLKGAFLAVCVTGEAMSAIVEAEYGDVRLKGPYGDRLVQLVEKQVVATDVKYLTDAFTQRTERNKKWQTEFWGKFMLSAEPYCRLFEDAALREKIERGVAAVMATQDPDGYIGNYPKDLRCNEGWDVWGMKFTLLGLLQHYDATGAGKSLDAAKRLGDFMIRNLGPDAPRTIGQTGWFAGMPSCSALEAIVRLYRASGEKRYLDFAGFIVAEMEKYAELLSQKDVPPYLRDGEKPRESKRSRLKAYEFLNCYQGMLEYYEVTGDRRCYEAALASASGVARDELNLSGGLSSGERWYHGAEKQPLDYTGPQETCVVTTWMRLCQKLLKLTGDPVWADRLETSFYNAYQAAMNEDCSQIASYVPLNGTRYRAHEQCRLHACCCVANCPRGYLSVLKSLFTAEENTAYLNLYVSGSARVKLPKSGRFVKFDTYTYYPLKREVCLENRATEAADFTLALRIPAWSRATEVKLNGEPLPTPEAGGYLRLNRRWEPGDRVELAFDLASRAHRVDGSVAFTRGPIALVRDTRFRDGDIGAAICHEEFEKADYCPAFTPVRRTDKSIRMEFVAFLRLAPVMHGENPDDNFPEAVRFCDFASGAGSWSRENACRMWLPITRWFGQ